MTDRELLEYAAKAAGIESFWGAGWESNHMYRSTPRPHSPLPTNTRWNPLDDDGDALRLAVNLGIDLEWRRDGRVAAYRYATSHGHCFTAFESSREDRNANTRRAIVRAAAEIGRAMP